jgi:hypothetical protein
MLTGESFHLATGHLQRDMDTGHSLDKKERYGKGQPCLPILFFEMRIYSSYVTQQCTEKVYILLRPPTGMVKKNGRA